MKSNCLYSHKTGNLRIEFYKDSRNWIIYHGSDCKYFIQNSRKWYFSKIESAIEELFRLLLKHNLSSLDKDEFLKAISDALIEVCSISENLSKSLTKMEGNK